MRMPRGHTLAELLVVVLILGALACVAVPRLSLEARDRRQAEVEARKMLEDLIQQRMERSLTRGQELDFPVEAGRRLLDLYLRTQAEPGLIRPLVLHLIDQDPEHAENYRAVLTGLDGRS